MTTDANKSADARKEVLELLATEGIRAAAQATIAVCRDPKATPQARATAAGVIMRAVELGGFGRGSERSTDKEPHEMTAQEIDDLIAAAKAEITRRTDPEDFG